MPKTMKSHEIEENEKREYASTILNGTDVWQNLPDCVGVKPVHLLPAIMGLCGNVHGYWRIHEYTFCF